MIRRHVRWRKGFERRLHRRWRKALDLFEATYTACREVGEEFYNRHSQAAIDSDDVKFYALTLLHGRAVLVGSEIHALLRTGHATGAQARWRTLHEIAVIAFVLSDGEAALSERFLFHRQIERYKDALRYQEYCEKLGYEKFTDEEMAEFEKAKEAVVAKYPEAGYRKPWGWAKPLFPSIPPKEAPTFDKLEQLAGVEHLRPWVRLAHHTIHSGASGALSIETPYREDTVLSVGPTNIGLADPAHSALVSLFQVTTVYVLHGVPDAPTPETLVALKAISRLLGDTGSTFVDIQGTIDAEEQEIRDKASQAKAAREGSS
jgi:hypothetical protein